MFPSRQQARTLAHGLGWFSVAFGVAQLLAGRRMARAAGLRGHGTRARAYGLRELVTGVGLLNTRHHLPWMWARVAGDVLDLATLVAGTGRRDGGSTGRAVALAGVAAVTALDALCLRALSQPPLQAVRDYGQRSGFPQGVDQVRGAARGFEAPADLRTPQALKPWVQGRPAAGHSSPASLETPDSARTPLPF